MDVIYETCSKVFDTAQSLCTSQVHQGFSPLISEAGLWGFNRAPLSEQQTTVAT